MAAPPHIENAPAIVFDISCRGIGLVISVPLAAGDRVSLAWEHGPRRGYRTIAATVLHVAARRDESWRVGCSFDTPLDPSDLRAFLRYCARL